MRWTSADTVGVKFLRNDHGLTFCARIHKEPSFTDDLHDSSQNAMVDSCLLQCTINRLNN